MLSTVQCTLECTDTVNTMLFNNMRQKCRWKQSNVVFLVKKVLVFFLIYLAWVYCREQTDRQGSETQDLQTLRFGFGGFYWVFLGKDDFIILSLNYQNMFYSLLNFRLAGFGIFYNEYFYPKHIIFFYTVYISVCYIFWQIFYFAKIILNTNF